jgi:hypothetical protein
MPSVMNLNGLCDLAVALKNILKGIKKDVVWLSPYR